MKDFIYYLLISETDKRGLKLPRQLLPQVQRLFAYQVGNRQLLLGEGGGR